jgi:hypothetical protein
MHLRRWTVLVTVTRPGTALHTKFQIEDQMVAIGFTSKETVFMVQGPLP